VTTTFERLPPGPPPVAAAQPGPDLDACGWTEAEYVARGRACAYTSAAPLPADGAFLLTPAGEAEFATRVVVRRPADPAACSGTVVVEWLNVSSGQDAAPDWTYLADELVRRGHAWVGVSAQSVGVEGGASFVSAGGIASTGLKGAQPERYGALHHPGDAYCYDVFTQVARAVVDGPLADIGTTCRLAVGESQSATTMTTYVNGVHPLAGHFDGFLVHSRAGWAAGLGEAGSGLARTDASGNPTRIREDVGAPVLVVQTETDVLGRLDFLPARQPDGEWLRTWEVAGTAHADLFQIGEFEELLGCPDPVNRGQQRFVVRAALRRLEEWARGGSPAPAAPPLSVTGSAFDHDDIGNVRGGVRTPAVDAPVSVLSGLCDPGASMLCQLFGRTTALPPEQLAALYGSRQGYLDAYAAATDRAISEGFLLPEDRDAVLADADPDAVPEGAQRTRST
jgi:hypothetical protein